MILSTAHTILAMGPPPGQQSSAPSLLYNLPLLLLPVIFYFLFFRPQRQKEKLHDALIKGLRPGDKIQTASGIIGTVISVKEKSLSIRSADSKLEILKTAVLDIVERSGEASEAGSST